MADCECQCAEGAPVGWRRIPGGGRGLPFGRPGPGFGPGFGGGFGANNNNNNNNNNNDNSSNNNASNNMMSALSNLLGLNSLNGLSNVGLGGFGGFGPGLGLGGFGGFPFGGPGGFPFGGFGPGGFPPPPCGGPPGQDCCCPPGPCCCGPCPPCSPPDCQPCNSVCWKRFRIVAPDGRECCFPVAVPWWCCGDDDGATGPTGATGSAEAIEAPVETIEQTLRAKPEAAKDGCMSASQLLMQRYMIANPPRAFGRPAGCAGRPEEMEIIDCPDCEHDEPGPRFAAAMAEFQRNAVLIPSEET